MNIRSQKVTFSVVHTDGQDEGKDGGDRGDGDGGEFVVLVGEEKGVEDELDFYCSSGNTSR